MAAVSSVLPSSRAMTASAKRSTLANQSGRSAAALRAGNSTTTRAGAVVAGGDAAGEGEQPIEVEVARAGLLPVDQVVGEDVLAVEGDAPPSVGRRQQLGSGAVLRGGSVDVVGPTVVVELDADGDEVGCVGAEDRDLRPGLGAAVERGVGLVDEVGDVPVEPHQVVGADAALGRREPADGAVEGAVGGVHDHGTRGEAVAALVLVAGVGPPERAGHRVSR